MFKKIMLPAIIITALLTFNSVAFAEPSKNIAKRQDITAFQLTKNLDGTKTFERNQVITGRAENGSEITMTVFWFKANEDKSILSKRRLSEDGAMNGQWVMQGKFSWEVGASEIFARPVTLSLGKNRIIINVRDPKSEAKEEVVNVEVVHKNELTDLFSSFIMKNMK